MLFIEYPKCSTCQRAKKWLEQNEIPYTDRHIQEENPTYEELREWLDKSGLPLRKFFNTSGMLYKSMQLKDKLPGMSCLLYTSQLAAELAVTQNHSQEEEYTDVRVGDDIGSIMKNVCANNVLSLIHI